MKRLILLAAAALSLAACSTYARMGDAERLSIYREHAGEPVDSFRYFRSLNGWTPLGDEALAVWTRPNEAYLIELKGHCPNLEFAHGISLTEHFGTVHARFDRVTPLASGSPVIPCLIEQIRPLDVSAIKDAERERRETAQTQARDPAR